MKRFSIITVILLSVVLLTVFAVNAGAQDKKEATKQEEVKVQKTVKKDCNPENCAYKCQEKIANTDCCKDHDAGKCTHEKCDCGLKPGSKECLEKHAKGECQEHKSAKCCQTDQTKKEVDEKELNKKKN